MRPQTIVERLDFVAKRVQGLKFTPPTQLKPGDDQFYGCFMSCDMYYIEIKVDQSHQSVKDVIISHGNSADGISCPVLKKVLADQDFETFAKHLTGLHSIYQINTNDKKVKQRAYPALTALEADLTILYDHQRRRVNNLHDLVHKSPIGFMEPRKGGLPVKLTYFITPYDLIDTTHKSLISITANNIVDKNLGLSATVEIEGSSPHKIQIKSLITQHNSSLPIYAPFNSQNSEKLPAQFVLKLSQPFPMLNTSISQIINEINEPATIREFLSSIMTSSKESIISLIARQELDLNKGPFCRTVDSLKGADSELCDLKKHVYSVKLPDQSHTYHILDNYLERPDAVYVTKIPFTHPTSIPSILKVLRQQALFNFVLGSCIRRNKGSTNNASTVANHNIDENLTNNSQVPNIFDVLPVSLNSVCVAFEHPSRESLATLELDIREISCQLYALDKESVCSDEFATKVLQKCWSIPVTLRSVLKKCNERRLALLEDSNKRRERELQELLSNNSSTQQNLQLKPNLKYRDTIPQSNPNSSSEKSNPRDLNSIAEFLSNKVNNANTSDNHRQNDANFDNSSSRTNLLKKFSCKPKVKQNTTTKSQIGNKILSQMLKRQNSTIVIDDPVLRGPVTKKIKTKNLSGESTSAETSSTPTLTTTKLISPEVANAARLMNKQAKQAGKNQSISLSLIRAPNKTQASAMSSTTRVNLSLTTNQKPPDPSVQKVKSQTNGSGSPVDLEGARKTSINAIIDKICLGVNDEKDGKNESDQQAHSDQANFPINSMDTNRNADSQKGTSNGAKTKTRAPGGDQFAIKQGSSGGGLKLTVTKTKPSNATMPSSSTQSITLSATNSNPSSTSTSTSSNSSTSSSSNSNPNSKQSDASKIIDLGLAAPSIRYTIPKISKTQQASQSSTSNANSSDNTANVSSNDVSQPDESTNPSSSGNSSTAPSSTTTKRTTSNPFNRNGSTNRNSVSSSTHPSNRNTSNPLANALSRPSSTSNIDNHIMNRISSSSNNGQPGAANSRIPQVNRPMNMMPQTRMPAQTIMSQQPFNVAQRFINPGLMAQQSQASLPLIGQPLPQQMFALRMQQQGGIFSNPNDLNIIAANQVALLNQQQQQLQQQRQQISQQTLNSQVQSIQQHQQASVSSSSDTSREDRKLVSDSQAATSSSTPSSPTECDQAQIIAPPPLIPIDSLHEARPASPDEEHDDASDRLSIVDMVDFADGNSIAGTPKPNEVSSPKEVSHDSNSASSSSIPAAQSGPEMSAPTSMSRSDLGSATTTTTVTAAVSAASTATNSTTASTSNVTANQDAIVGSASTTADDSVNASASSSFISEQTDLAPVSAASHNTNSAPSGKPVTTSEQHVMQPPEISPSLDTDMAITAQSPQSTITATTQDE